MTTQTNKNRVVVAMSGGVDSTVAAFLLKEQGFDVIGISLKLWDEQKSVKREGRTCCSFEDVHDAKRVCDKLDIPFYAFNHKKEFEEKVVRNFVTEYHQGRTPNPCILCNQHLKFDKLLSETSELGASYLATGHHARVDRDAEGRFRLLKGIDAAKDQSYVLYRLGQKELNHLLFPVGNYSKEEVRAIAHKNSLPTADKAESQDICFIPQRDHGAFIEKHYPDYRKVPGNFIDSSGKILGRHEGLHHYTVGQRRGLGIGAGERLYVLKINVETDEVVLGTKDESGSSGLYAHSMNWIGSKGEDFSKTFPLTCSAKVRYQKDEIECVIERGMADGEVVVRFVSERRAVAPGQAVVFYDHDEVLGGGIIDRALETEGWLV